MDCEPHLHHLCNLLLDPPWFQDKSLEADIISNSLFRYCHWQRAKELLELQSKRSLEATTISYNSVMAGCPWHQALAVQEQIFRRSLRVSVVTWKTDLVDVAGLQSSDDPTWLTLDGLKAPRDFLLNPFC